ncbi:g4045 [Coccomyxa viridis]|uniref:G4037 protein n=1 Tax=Coccomyxa viridis TaxID=1274662 RepID=A0ABP1FTA1_9CHLO
MRPAHARRAQQRSVDVQVPGKGKALLHILADGRSTGRYKLSKRQLDEVPEVWQGTSASDGHDGKWWEAVDTVALDLSSNNIRSLPVEITNLSESLETLNICNNPLQELPGHVGALQQLKVLDVSGTGLPHMPGEVAALQNLVKLLCQGNVLSALPDCLGLHQQRLQHVDCSNNKLHELPNGLTAASGLLSLKASSNTISSLRPEVVLAWGRLTSLDISHNCISALPDTVPCLQRLAVLEVSHNCLEELPEGIGGCTSLVELLCSNNSISCLPESISRLRELKTLDLRANRLATLPEAACSLKLALLDLADNDLAGLPPQLGRMTTLRALPLSGNPLRGLRSNQAVASTLRTLRNRLEETPEIEASQEPQGSASTRIPAGATSIELRGRGLQQVPDQIWASAASLQKLNLAGNALKALDPGQLAPCTALQVLDLSSNAFTEWPLPGGQLPPLRQLRLSSNGRLLSAPQEALQGCAGSLRSLDISGTPAAACLDVRALPQLKTLCMARCALRQMPIGVYASTGLRSIDVSSNSIAEVHEDISKLTALEELNLMNNSISGLPPKMGLLHGTLRVLMLDGNPLRSIRRPILERGTTVVLEYLQTRIPVP